MADHENLCKTQVHADMQNYECLMHLTIVSLIVLINYHWLLLQQESEHRSVLLHR
ncbi:MAG: hypothetical protein H6Q59_953 [Firmicutes bacterium]|nr:hypothetical protein [Bacillota bacterium]